MTDKDKLNFDIWIGIDKLYDPWKYSLAEMSWQAACEYKQKEIDELKEKIKFVTEELEHIYETSDDRDSSKSAREALKLIRGEKDG